MAKEFREHFLGLLTLFIVSLSIYGFIRLSSHAAAARSKDLAPAPTTDIGSADQHLFAAIYTTTGGQTSILGLNNSQNHPITAQVTLYNKHGAALAIPPITIDGHKNHGFDIADWVRNVDGFEEGSLEVFYHDASMAMGAQETIIDANHSLSFDVHLQEPMDFMSPRADGLWWALGDSNTNAQVFIANTRETQTTVTPIFYLDGVAHQGDAIILNGHESDVIDIKKALKKLHLSTTAIGGISLTSTNGPGGLAMVGVISNKQTGLSTTMRFIDQHSQHTTTLHGTNILIGKPGPDSGFASTTRFTPHVVVRNNSDQTVQIHPRIRYVLNDQPNVIDLAALSLAANQVRELDLTSAINTIGNNTISDTGIEIDHTGNPGTVMAYASSIDQSGSSVFDVPIKDPTSEMGFKGGSYPWNIESDNRAVLHIKNIDQPGDGQKRQAMAKLYFDGGDYNIPLQEMEAGQTVEVDIKKLRDDQVPDVLGHLIPLTVTSGQLDWGPRAQRGQFIGRLVQYDPVSAIASSFSCVGACLCDNSFGSAVIYPGLFSGFIGDTFGLQSTETDVDCNQQVVYTYNVGSTQGLQYSSSDSNVVTISDGTAAIVGIGHADITADWDAFQVTQHCFYSAEGDCVDATCNSNTVPNPIGDSGVDSFDVKILRDGTDITGTTTNIIVGQQINLVMQVLPEDDVASQIQWSVPGTRVQNYVASSTSGSATPLTNLGDGTVSFYWVNGGDGLQVTLSCTVNDRQVSKSATFNVKRPTAQITTTTGNVVVGTAWGDPELSFGTPSTLGITFSRTITIPAGFSGSTQWVQIVNPLRRRQLNSGGWERWAGIGLDTSYPFDTAPITSDSPAEHLTGSFLQDTADDSFQMCLMFKANGTSTIWVPLREVLWSWSGAASRSGTIWTLDSSGHSTNPSDLDLTTHPTWTRNAASNTWVPE